MFEMLGDIVKPGKKKHAKTFRNNGDINDGIITKDDIYNANVTMMKSRLAYANEFGNPAAKRMINIPDNPYEFDNGDTGTHYMASYDNYAVPQVQDENGVLQLGDYGPESNEAIRFDSDEDANYFAENYKNVSPGFLNQKQYGGLQKFVVGGQPPCGPDEAVDPKTGLCSAVAMTQNLPEADVYSKASTRKLQGTLTDKLQQMRNAFQNSRASNMKDGDKYNFGLNLGDETNDVRELPGRIARYKQAIELEKTKYAKDSYTLNQLKQYDPEHWDLKDQSKRFQRKPYEARSAEGLAALRSAVKSGAMSQEDFNYAYNDWGKHVDQNAVQGKGPGAGYNSKDVDWDSEDTKKFTKGLGVGVNALTLGMGAAFAAPIVPMALKAASSGIAAATPVYEGIMSTPLLGTAEPAIANAAPITNMIRTALTGNNLAKAYGITKSSYDLLDGSTYNANKKVVTDAAKGEFNIGNVATALGKDLGLVSTVSNFTPQVNNYAGYIPKAAAKVGTGHSLESPYSVNTVIKGVIDANKKLSEIAIKQEGGTLLTKKVTCKSCGWTWDAADGGNDVTTCHKCGGQGLVHAQDGGLYKFVDGGPTSCPIGQHWDGVKCVLDYEPYSPYKQVANNALTNNVSGVNAQIAETQRKGMAYQSTADELNVLNKQQEKLKADEAKRKALEAQERQRQQQLRTVGSDNTRVDNSIIKNSSVNFQLPHEQAQTITKAQKDAARQIVTSGDFGNYFPEQMDYYLSTENSHRQGGPLTLEELALQQIRTNPDFFQILEEKKYQDFQKREQKMYDNMPWYMKGINTVNALASDPLTTLERGLLEWERPLAFQGLQSTDPSIVGDDARFYDRALDRNNNVLNNTLNYINPFRAASSAGQNLQQGDYGDAVVDFATILPMLKGAKAGWRGFTGLNNALNTGINTGLTKAGASSLVQGVKAGWRAPLPLGKTITNATAGTLTPGAALGLGFGIHGALNAPEDLNRFIANPNLDTGVDLGMSTLEMLTSPGMGNAMKFGVKGVKDLAKLFSTDSKAASITDDIITNSNQSGLIPTSNKSVSPISFESVPQRGPDSYQIKMNNEWIGDFDLEKDFTNKANGNWVIGNVYLKEGYQGQGLGKESFIQANKLLESQGKGTLHSSGYFNGSQAKNVWESLVKEGKAEKIGKDAWKFKSTKSSSSSKNSFNASNSDVIDPANTGAPLNRFIEKKYLSKEEAEALKLANPQMKTKLIKEAKINGTLLPERFPMTIEGQQQAFDDATDFGLNWGLKDADAYNTIQSDFLAKSQKHSDLLNELKQYGSSTRFQEIDQKVSEIYANIMDEYLQLENMTVDDYLRSGDPQHYQEFFANKRAEIIAENSQKSIDLQRGESYRNKIAKLESEKQQLAHDLQLLHNSKQSQIDPTFKEKVQNLYREAGIPEMQIPKNAFYDGQGIPITNFGKNRVNLVEMNQLDPLSEPSFAALSDADQTYLANNWKKLNGVRTNDATITFQSKIYDDYYTERTAPKTTYTTRYEPAKEWHPLKPWTWKNYNSVGKHVREVNRGPYIDEPILIEKLEKIRENPTELAGVNVHEIGHDYQEFFQDWGKLLTEYDPQKGYYTAHSKNKLAKRFQNAMIKGKNITKEQLKKGDYNYDTWLSSPNELHSELMKARYKVYNNAKAEQPEMSQRDIINWIKEGEARGDDNIFDFYIRELNRHFKPETTNAERKALIKLLPVLIPAVGFGVTKGMDNETPQNKYGGNVKTLSKFIKK